jgi:hypothetical protein
MRTDCMIVRVYYAASPSEACPQDDERLRSAVEEAHLAVRAAPPAQMPVAAMRLANALFMLRLKTEH